jgi:hypothetical protein
MKLTKKELEIIRYHLQYDIEGCSVSSFWKELDHTEEEADKVLAKIDKEIEKYGKK